ncbi:MAG: PorT family protein [Bacteroidota bacterium]|nr:PorT family protein [Bacteroidota bacterium]
MKKIIYAVLIACSIVLTQTSITKAEMRSDPKYKFKSNKNFSDEIKNRDYSKALKVHKKITGSLLGASLDFQVGYGTTSANATTRINGAEIPSESRGGFTAGANLNINLLNLFSLTTGVDFIKKKYEIDSSVITLDSSGNTVRAAKVYNNDYINIPLNANISGMLSDKIGYSFSGGPYLGFLLNADEAANGFKSFDLGLNGILTGKYYLNPFLAIILGGKVQYGGLNNLLSTSTVETAHTTNWAGFTGLSVGF